MTIAQKPEWREVHYDRSTIVDLHAHPSLKVSLFNKLLTRRHPASRYWNPFSVRTDFNKLKDGGLDVLFSVIYPPEPEIVRDCKLLSILKYVFPPKIRKLLKHPAKAVAEEMMAEMETAVATSNGAAKVVRSIGELDVVLAQGDERPIAVVHCLEGAHSLGGKLENLDQFYLRGVAYITLAHFYPNDVAHPCYPYPAPLQLGGCRYSGHDITQGLTTFGEQVVERMVELGMLIDITHCTPAARQRVFEIVGQRAPLLATHIGAYDINPDPYNLKDWEIKKIADSGGLVGVIFMNYWLAPYHVGSGINIITKTLAHFNKVAGINHLAIGTDFDGFTDPPDDLKDAAALPGLTKRLLAEGYKPEDIAKIWGGNVLRVLRYGWGKR